MKGWTLLVDRRADRDALDPDLARLAVTARHYVTRPGDYAGPGRKIVNLSRSYAYLGTGYYASLLAEARGHKVVPTVAAMVELSQRALLRRRLPGLEDELNRRARRLTEPPAEGFTLFVAFGETDDARFPAFARRVFEALRVPLVEVRVRHGAWLTIGGVRAVGLDALDDGRRAVAMRALRRLVRGPFASPRPKGPPRWRLAVLIDPKEALPPSGPRALKRLARAGAAMDVAVETIGAADLPRLAEFDALFIRRTTAIDDVTFRFARRAEQEGMPVIDDPTSILRCTNKVYLAELMRAAGVPVPRTRVIDRMRDLDGLGDDLGWPVVLKIPDGSFSRGVEKAGDPAALARIARGMLADSDLILAQEYMYTEYDWRVGVLGGEPLFVCQYLMAKKHWQIVRHTADGKADEGGFRTVAVAEAPAEVVDVAVRAARPIGDGLYGVDLKQTPSGVHVIEVNDNPNLDAGVEDAVLRDALWRAVIGWFLARLEGTAPRVSRAQPS